MSRRSREIGWGPAEITLWEIQRELACGCSPSKNSNCTAGGNWVSHEDDLYSAGNVLFGNTVSDINCNTYTVWGVTPTEGLSYFVMEKRDSAGTMLWQKSYGKSLDAVASNDIGFGTITNISLGTDGCLYVTGWSWATKISPSGEVLWASAYSNVFNLDGEFMGSSVDSDNNLIINGMLNSVYISSIDSNVDCIYVVKLSGYSGAVITEKYYYLSAQQIYGAEPYSVPATDSKGNSYILPIGDWVTYQGVVVKLDKYLTPIWNTKILNDDVITGDQDGTAVRVDSNQNVFFNDFGSTVIKVSSLGDFVWCTRMLGLNSSTEFTVAADGSIYILQNSFGGPGGSLNIISLDKNGVYQWAYKLENATDGVTVWENIPYCFTRYNDNLYLQNVKNTLKLPLTAVVPGTYGNYTITDVTGSFTPEYLTIPLTSSTITAYPTLHFTNSMFHPTLVVDETTFAQTNAVI